MAKYTRNAAGRCIDENGKWAPEDKCVRSEAAQKRARKAKRAATAAAPKKKPAVRKTAPKKKPVVRKAAPKKKK